MTDYIKQTYNGWKRLQKSTDPHQSGAVEKNYFGQFDGWKRFVTSSKRS